MLRYIESNQIDRLKWDRCIRNSEVAHIYGLSWYMDLVASGWAGIIKNDYQAVMPLPIKKKFGIKYVFQPPFTQQLGVYSRETITSQLLQAFLNIIPPELKYVDVNLNYTNNFDNNIKGINRKVNFELSLKPNYNQLKDSYSENTKRNIQKSIPFIEITENVKIVDLLRLKREATFNRKSGSYYEWLNCFINRLINSGYGKLTGAIFNDQLCAAALFVFFGKRIYYLIPVSSNTGREKRAMFAILDHYIYTYSEKDLILDFEGSNIPGIARFFAGFGALPVIYPSIKINRLPSLLQIFKK